MAFTNVELTGTFKGANEEPLTGRVTATLSTSVQNGTLSIAPTKVVGNVVNGALSMHLVANNDLATLPVGSFYVFRVELQRTETREFKAIVQSNAPEGKVDISTLYESSGFIGAKVRPQISASPTLQELSEVLVVLGLAEEVQKPFARDL
jgi:hypothetical protein